MQAGRVIFTLKCLGSPIKQYSHVHGMQTKCTRLMLSINPTKPLFITRASHALAQKSYESRYEDLKELEVRETLITGFLKRMKLLDPDKYRRMLYGTLLYERTVDNLDYGIFFKTFELPDTFVSWFVITELHMWMVMVRLMAIPKIGQDIRNRMIEAMWTDVHERLNKLGKMRHSVKKDGLIQISQQFNATIIDYDEGMMCDDKALAAALWRGFFNSATNNPIHLEKLVIYVRRQLVRLDEMGTVEFVKTGQIKWIDINKI